jgi:hypothetical protein
MSREILLASAPGEMSPLEEHMHPRAVDPVIDFIFWLHFITSPYQVGAFVPGRAIGLGAFTATVATKGCRVVTIRPEQSVREAVTLLVGHGIGALVVVGQGGGPVGIVTERHIIRRLAADEALLDRAVAEAMTTDLVTATPQDELPAILHVPILDAGERGEADTLEAGVLDAS